MNEQKVFRTWAEAGIDTGNRSTGSIKTTCPKCSETRKNKRDKSLSVNLGKRVWNCHHCGWSGGIMEESRNLRIFTRPEQRSSAVGTKLEAWFKERCITPETLEYFKVTESVEFVPQVSQKRNCINFNYYRNKELVNIKFRDGKKNFFGVAKAELIFYNLDAIKGQDECLICEGEIDCMSWYEAGFYRAVSVPNGASKGNAKLEYLDNCWPYFEHMKKVVIATDGDEAGMVLREELARRIGKGVCSFVEYPEGCKDANDVLKKYGKDRLNEIGRSAKQYPIEGIQSLDDVDDELEYIYKNGFPKGDAIGYPKFDKLITWRKGEFTTITGVPQSGKALAIDTPIPTPSGWTTMGDLRVGDSVFDEKGNICKVLKATEIMHNRECFKVSFSDGSKIICDAEHNWLTRDDKARRSMRLAAKRKIVNKGKLKLRGTDQSHLRSYPSVKTTSEISESIYAEKGNRFNHSIAVTLPLQTENISLPIPPYTLGAWLGDGTSAGGGFTYGDSEIIDNIRLDAFEVSKQARVYGYGIKKLTLRDVGLLDNKHIPSFYLRASIEQRIELLKGLMDTDGTIGLNRQCEFTSINKALAEGVFDLLCSLGILPTIRKSRAKLMGKDCRAKYRVMFTANIPVFKLTRKLKIQEANSLKTSGRLKWRQITGCKRVDSVPVKCIMVSSKSHLFLCGKTMIPTHNSNFIDQIMIRLAARHGWKFGVFSPESAPVELHAISLIQKYVGHTFAGKNKMTPVQKDAAKKFVNENFWFMKFSEIELTIDGILDKARELVLRCGINGLVIDPFNYIEFNMAPGETETQYISKVLTKIKNFCEENNVHIWLVAHPTKIAKDRNTKEYEVPNLYSISGSANFFNKTYNGFTTYRHYQTGVIQVFVQKVKFFFVGQVGVSSFVYDKEGVTGRYAEVEMDEATKEAMTEPIWENEMRDFAIQQPIPLIEQEERPKGQLTPISQLINQQPPNVDVAWWAKEQEVAPF